MNYIAELQSIIDDLRHDRSVDPKWRNTIAKRLEETQAICQWLYGPIADVSRAAHQQVDSMMLDAGAADTAIPSGLREAAHGVTRNPFEQGTPPVA